MSIRKTSGLQSPKSNRSAHPFAKRTESVDPLRVARDKIVRVFRYLEALNQHRNPVQRQLSSQQWSFWLRDLPNHPSTQRGVLRSPARSAKDDASHGDSDHGDNFVLKVRRPKLSAPPQPPREVADWLKDGWDDPAKKAAFHESRKNPEGEGESATEKFGDVAARMAAFNRWQPERDAWAANEKPARAAMKVFEMLYELHGRLEREAEQVELILGDGILSWRVPEDNIYHPILLQRLQLEFNAAIPEFTLSETEHPVELYSALFQSLSSVDGRAIGRCREELERGDFHPLGGDPTTSFLKRLVVQLSSRGELVEGAPEGEQSEPRIGRDPVIFVRQRTLGFAAAIEGILQDVRTRRELPWSLLNIVGEAPPIVVSEPSNGAEDPASPTVCTDVLLSKPANPEQIRIAQQLEKHGGVLVQGPPGTGKTHTIGNLIGHLLAKGKSILVTSHTTKALRMVRHHIVPELRPLCVSVLESDLESRKQLESAVGSIAERLSRADAGSLTTEATRLESERVDLLKKLEEIRKQLRDARVDEYRDIAIGGKSWAPADAARQVVQEKDPHGWIPGPVAAVAPLPLSPGELADLYRTGVSISREDENEISGHLPDLHSLPRAEEFEASISERNRLGMEDLEVRCDLWDSHTPEGSPREIEELAAALTQAVEPLSGREKWKLAAVYAGKYGDIHRQSWDQLVALVRLVHREAANAQESFLKFGPEGSADSSAEEQERVAGEIIAHLEDGGKLGSITLFAHKSWSQFLEQTKVNNT